ncbi:MAG: GerW family sporulation protein [Syntrophomonas sp.]
MEAQEEKNSHPIEGLMKTAMQSIKEMVDVNTVVGDAVETNDGTVIIPISQVACGFAAGGGEYEINLNGKSSEMPFAGGSGAGVSVRPIGFLVCRLSDVRLISVSGNHLAERIVDIAPQIMDKLENALRHTTRGSDRSEHKEFQ